MTNSCECIDLCPSNVTINFHGCSSSNGGGIGTGTGGTSWSFEEAWTGGYWVDGKKVYAKTVDCGPMPNAARVKTPHGIVGIETVVKLEGVAISLSIGQTIHLPNASAQAGSSAGAFVERESIVRHPSNNLTMFERSYVTIYYTCIDL